MKPRSQINRRVTELSATLQPIRTTDLEWINNDYKKTYKNKGLSYYLVLERCQEFQVIRYYYRSRKRFFEFMQVWIDKDCNEAIRAKRRYMRVDGWVEDSDMKLWKYSRDREYSYLGGISRLGWSGAKVRSLLPELKQRGIKSSTHGIHPVRLIKALLTSNRLETLFKVRQYCLVHELSQPFVCLDDAMWQSIRVALRHGYHWDSQQEVKDWLDMLSDLRFIGLDTHSPHYICPKHLCEAHRHWSEVRRRFEKGERVKEIEKAVRDYEPTFYQNRHMFFGMAFTDGEIDIQIIPTAMGIREEGEAMHHCVGGYYNRPDSLILSAKIDGKRIETIEVRLSDYQLVQSRGLQNKSTEYHERIVNLVNANMDEIRSRNTKHKIAV